MHHCQVFTNYNVSMPECVCDVGQSHGHLDMDTDLTSNTQAQSRKYAKEGCASDIVTKLQLALQTHRTNRQTEGRTDTSDHKHTDRQALHWDRQTPEDYLLSSCLLHGLQL